MRPFGYDVDRTKIREDEAAILRDAAKQLLAGESLRGIVTRWNQEGHRTSAGNPWKPNVLRRVLLSPRIAGLTDEDEPAEWPAILNDDTYQELSALLTAPERTTNPHRGDDRVYLLTGGAAHCALCGEDLVAKPDNHGRRGYVCPSGAGYDGCGRIRITAEAFETDVAERVLGRLMAPANAEKITAVLETTATKGSYAERQISVNDLRAKELAENYAQGFITAGQLRGGTKRLKDETKKLRKQVRIAEALRTLDLSSAGDLARWWEVATNSERRALIDGLVERIEVSPVSTRGSKLYEHDRVRVVWRRPGLPSAVRQQVRALDESMVDA